MAKKKDKDKFLSDIFHVLAQHQTDHLLDDTFFYELEEFRELIVSWSNNEYKEEKQSTRDRNLDDENQLELPSIDQN